MKEIPKNKTRKFIYSMVLTRIMERENEVGYIKENLYNSFTTHAKLSKSKLFYSPISLKEIKAKIERLKETRYDLKEGECLFIDPRTSIPIKRVQEHFKITKDISEADHVITHSLDSFDNHETIILEDDECIYFILNTHYLENRGKVKIGDNLKTVITTTIPNTLNAKYLDWVIDSIGFNNMKVTYIGNILEGGKSLVNILNPIIRGEVRSIITSKEYDKYICKKHSDLTIDSVDNILSLMRSEDEETVIHGINTMLMSNYHGFPSTISMILSMTKNSWKNKTKAKKLLNPLLKLRSTHYKCGHTTKELDTYKHLVLRSLAEYMKAQIKLSIEEHTVPITIEDIKRLL